MIKSMNVNVALALVLGAFASVAAFACGDGAREFNDATDDAASPGPEEPPAAGGLPAQKADAVVDFLGVSFKGQNADGAKIKKLFSETGLRWWRSGRVDLGPGKQSELAQALAKSGLNVKALAMVDDYGLGTPASRMHEVCTQWGGLTIGGWEGPNEVQRGVKPDAWEIGPVVEPKNGFGPEPASPWDHKTTYDEANDRLSVVEARRQLVAIKEARAMSGCGANMPIVSHSLSLGLGSTEYFEKQGDITSLVDVINLHKYAAAADLTLEPVHNGKPTMQEIIESSEPMGGTTLPVWITETGWHDYDGEGPTHPYTPRPVSGIYMTRSIFKLMRLPRVQHAFLYTGIDLDLGLPDGGEKKHEEFFGLYYNKSDGSIAPKPHAIVLGKINALYADVGPAPDFASKAFTPAKLDASVTGPAGSMVDFDVRQKSDGTHLLAIWRNISVYTPPKDGPAGVGTRLFPPDVQVTVAVPPGRTIKQHRFVNVAADHTTTFGDTVTTLNRSPKGTVVIPVGADATVLEILPASASSASP